MKFLKAVFQMLVILLVLGFALAAVGMILLCALFGNVVGYILIAVFSMLLIVNIFLILNIESIEYGEEKDDGI